MTQVEGTAEDGPLAEASVNRPSARPSGSTLVEAESPSAATASEVPELPDYKVIRQLGSGGMGVVYLARNLLMDRMEVLKVLARHLVDQPHAMDRFLREIQSAAQLNHRNIVRAYSTIRWNKGLILAMEYVEGQDLAERVEAKGPMPVAEACSCIYQAARGLHQAHLAKMVHRDIKPANLIIDMVRDKGIVKILDFGLAKVTSEGPVDGGMTRQGLMLGTPDYMAPEQIRNAHGADIRADIYSLGCTLYYLLAGRPPFDGDSLYDILQAHHSNEANALDLVRSDVPVELAALVAKMMAKEPDHRFQTPAEVAEAILPFFRPGGDSGTRPAVKPPSAESTPRRERQRTLVEDIPLVSLSARPSPGADSSGGSWNRQATLQETPGLPTRAPANARISVVEAIPPRQKHRTIAAVGWVVVALLAVGFGLSMWTGRTVKESVPPVAVPAPYGNQNSQVAKSVKAAVPLPFDSSKSGFGTGNSRVVANTPAKSVTPIGPRYGASKQALSSAASKAPMNNAANPENRNGKEPAAELLDISSKLEPALEQPTVSSPGRGIAAGADGYVRTGYQEVALSPDDYKGRKIVLNDYFKISTRIIQDEKYVPGFGALIVRDKNNATISDEHAKSPAGLGIVLDKSLAEVLQRFIAKEGIKVAVRPEPAFKVVPTIELRLSTLGNADKWLAVIVSLEVLAYENPDLIVSGDFEAAIELVRIDARGALDLKGRGMDWYQRLGGDKERSRLKHLIDEARKTEKINRNKKILTAASQAVAKEGFRSGSQQNADIINRGLRAIGR